MRCYRCGGMMVTEKYFGEGESYFALRCVNCGDIVDQLILQNRNANKI